MDLYHHSDEAIYNNLIYKTKEMKENKDEKKERCVPNKDEKKDTKEIRMKKIKEKDGEKIK